MVVPQEPPATEESATEAVTAAECHVEPARTLPGRISWARLLKRVLDIDMRLCQNRGGGELKTIAAILERQVVETILTHLGLDSHPPSKGRALDAGEDAAA